MSFEQNLKRMYSEFDEGQKQWFLRSFPNALISWFNGNYNGKQLSKNPRILEDYLDNTSLSASTEVKLDDVVIALWCVRKCHGPIHTPKLYRLTKLQGGHDLMYVTVRAKNELKPLTSWTSLSEPVVGEREPSNSDFVLAADVPKSFVLCSWDVLNECVQIVQKNAEHFELKKRDIFGRKAPTVHSKAKIFAERTWGYLEKELRLFRNEREYMVYLGPGDEFKAVVHNHVPLRH